MHCVIISRDEFEFSKGHLALCNNKDLSILCAVGGEPFYDWPCPNLDLRLVKVQLS